MPNHVTTICTVSGETEALRTFAEWLAGGGFDFNRIIPMPNSVKETESSTDASLGLIALTGADKDGRRGFRDYGIVPREVQTTGQLTGWLAKERPKALELGAAAVKAKEETGFYDWYDWARKRWGTKWNAYGTDTRETSADKVVFKFETAWSFPEPIFKRLTEMFPALVFEIASFDEVWNFACVGQWGGRNDYRTVKATDELYERVYGCKPERA